jgi:hypothetical protein
LAHYKKNYNINIANIGYQYDLLAHHESTSEKLDLKAQITKYNKENPKDINNYPIAIRDYRNPYMLTSEAVTDAFCTAILLLKNGG